VVPPRVEEEAAPVEEVLVEGEAAAAAEGEEGAAAEGAGEAESD
jgi:hypothetical protein